MPYSIPKKVERNAFINSLPKSVDSSKVPSADADGNIDFKDAVDKIGLKFESLRSACDMFDLTHKGYEQLMSNQDMSVNLIIGAVQVTPFSDKVLYADNDNDGIPNKDDPYPEAAALIVEAIAEQEIQDEFIWNKDGVEYTFYGDSLVPCSHSKGFLKANALLNQWLNKNPDMYEMAKTMLVHDVFMFLPLSYEEDEGQSLAFDILEEITRMMDRNDILEDVKKQIGFVSQQIS